ncbi:MAG TPA: iron export ABC transporter permease subunit FetB [Thermodesulfobacteriaceae bacterium]|nr:iron export ABC transporter permease subunit FetB [Thermodesulfobacteriaceae bacterium]
MSSFVYLTPFDILTATLLICMAAAISIGLRLGLERRLLLSAARCTIQLGMVGLILDWVFNIHHPAPVVAWLVVMLLFASREAVARSKWRYAGIRFDALLTMIFSAFVVGGVITQMVIGIEPWYNPQYVIPILGMIFGNSLNGISLCLDRLIEHIRSRSDEIELLIAYGATRPEAVAEPLQTAVKTGMIPIINNMAMAGVVSLPGMMTGQILAGSPPMQAVGYQMIVMFMITAACALGAMAIATMVSRRLVSPNGMLKLDKLILKTSRS